MAGLFGYGPLGMAIVIVTALGFAVLVGGAVDPALAIRRTTVYGTLVLLFAFGFAAIEELVAETLVGRIGISDRSASILLGALVAVAGSQGRCATGLRHAP